MQIWIANRWEDAADGRVFEVRNPATEERIDTAPRAGAANVDRAGYGPEAGAQLVAHRDVEVVAFTGSQATGRQVAVACATQLKKCHLELGGNDSFIVDEGVDLGVAAQGAVWACFLNMGQVCTSPERFFVVAKVFDEFVDRFVAFARTLRIGDSLGPDVDLGP